MKTRIIVLIVLLILLVVSAVQAVQLNTIKSNVESGAISTPASSNSGDVAVPSNVDNLPGMVGGC